jgi:hypothetical protein
VSLPPERRCEPPWAEDRSPTDRRTRWFCLPSVLFFQSRPFLIFPVFDSLLVSLVGSTLGLLQTQPQLLEQAANVSRMIADPKLPSDHYSHSLTRPYISSKPVRLSSLSQKLRQPRSLIFTQTWRCARRRLVSQGLHAPSSLARFIHWLTAPSVTPKASAISDCFQPRSFNSKARKRLPSRQLVACWLDSVFSIVG